MTAPDASHSRLPPSRSLLLWMTGPLAALLLLGSCRPAVPPERDLLVATASVGGTFYPVGVALAQQIRIHSDPEEPILASAITSSGSAENIRMLQLDEAQLAIVQSLFSAMAWEGSGFYQDRPVQELRAVAVLWPNVEQIVVRRSGQPTATSARQGLDALQGGTLSLGPRWSGTEVSGRTLLETLGYQPDQDFRFSPMGFGPGADALQDRRVDGLFFGSGVPTAAITRVLATLGPEQVQILPFSEEELHEVRSRWPVWSRFTIPADTYPGQEADIPTIAQPNLLVTSIYTTEEVIYEVTRILWENLEQLQRDHPATRSMQPELGWNTEPLPLHPGAERYYRERGWLPSSHEEEASE